MRVLLILLFLPADTNFIGKKELLEVPAVKSFIKHLDLIMVDRLDFSKSRSEIEWIEKTLKQECSELIFQEGSF